MASEQSVSWKAATVAAGLLLSIAGTADPVDYVQDNFIGSPGKPSQLIYSPAHDSVVMRSANDLKVMKMSSGTVATYAPFGRFTDISLSPDGRYVFVADFGGANRVGRLDLQAGTYETRLSPVVTYRIEATDPDKFIIASQDQWIRFWRGGWGAGSSISILNSNPDGYYPVAYYGDIEYDQSAGRLIHGNSGLSSQMIKAFALAGDDFVTQEDSGMYGSSSGYGGSSVLATDASRFYYGRLQVLASDVRQNQLVFPSIIVAATGKNAFASGGEYFDAATASSLGNLGYPVSTIGLNRTGDDFWAYDPSTEILRHFVSSDATPPPVAARPDFAAVVQGYVANIDVAANDHGFSDSVTIDISTPPAHGTVSVTGSPGSRDGIRVRYSASAGYTGPDSFEYSITDGTNSDSAPVGIDVAAAKAYSDSFVVLKNTSTRLYVIKNDIGFGAQVTVTLDGSPSLNGNANVFGSPGSKTAVYISYLPGYNAAPPYTETFSYQVSDGLHTDTALVAVHVVDFAAVDDELIVAADQPASLDLLANDLGFAMNTTVGLFSTPVHGSVSFNAGIATYSPSPGYLGPDSFEYFVDDGVHVGMATVIVSVIVDADADKVSDTVDNCLGKVNSDQRDTDGDQFGNRCDADLDQNGFVNYADLSIFRSRFGSSDADADFDGNGIVNYVDLSTLRSLFGKPPGPAATVN